MGIEREVVGKPFPKTCACGMYFKDRKHYLVNTTIPLSGREYGEIAEMVIEYRNCCRCKSTLSLEILDLRDYSHEGQSKRIEFIREHCLQEG